ncbi:hypothetical protein MKEN_00148000 [Mycena kentingensis (nom. inval.)]|nr:hypothetical protein MKEN_00148000 [Mycena kentingensis (nom. inval.)]
MRMPTTSSVAVVALGLASAASAAISTNGLSILAPGGENLWWLQGGDNNVAWTCSTSTVSQYTVWLNNTDQAATISAITALVSVLPNYNCIQLIEARLNSAPAAKGYTIVFTDIANATNVLAVSDEFEIKAQSAGYPPATNTPQDTGSATVVKGSGTAVLGSGSISATGATSSPTGGASLERHLSVGAVGLGAAVLGLLGFAL